MRIALITPAARNVNNGNRNTATRWAGFLRDAGHRVRIQTQWDAAEADIMIALHARRSYVSIAGFAKKHPERALIVTLTGTDLYRDIATDEQAQRSLQLATRLVVLQEEGLGELTPALRRKSCVIYQSAASLKRIPALRRSFEVAVIGHLREEKDPLRAAHALQYLPPESRVIVNHFGRSLDEKLAREAQTIMRSEPRYRWLSERPHWQVQRTLARAKLMVISSRMEGGANVVSEAIAAGCPILASRVSGNIGMLGKNYAGYFELENERELGALLWRCESDSSFHRQLKHQCKERRVLMTPRAERTALLSLVAQNRKQTGA